MVMAGDTLLGTAIERAHLGNTIPTGVRSKFLITHTWLIRLGCLLFLLFACE